MEGDPVTPANGDGKQRRDGGGPYKAQLFAADGEDIVIILKGQIQVFLPGFSVAQAEQAAGANGVQGL